MFPPSLSIIINIDIIIIVIVCTQSHLFVLQLVHRPQLRSIVQGLLRKRLVKADQCIAKIKRNFAGQNNNNGSGALTPSHSGYEDNIDPQQQQQPQYSSIKVSLRDPITLKRINLPARGFECKHIQVSVQCLGELYHLIWILLQCFDLESYLQMNSERCTWKCPICSKPAVFDGLEVDQYLWGMLTSAGPEVEEVTVDSLANWHPIYSKYKDEGKLEIFLLLMPSTSNTVTPSLPQAIVPCRARSLRRCRPTRPLCPPPAPGN